MTLPVCSVIRLKARATKAPLVPTAFINAHMISLLVFVVSFLLGGWVPFSLFFLFLFHLGPFSRPLERILSLSPSHPALTGVLTDQKHMCGQNSHRPACLMSLDWMPRVGSRLGSRGGRLRTCSHLLGFARQCQRGPALCMVACQQIELKLQLRLLQLCDLASKGLLLIALRIRVQLMPPAQASNSRPRCREKGLGVEQRLRQTATLRLQLFKSSILPSCVSAA